MTQLTRDIVAKFPLTTLMVTHNITSPSARQPADYDARRPIILDIPPEQKKSMQTDDLLRAFEEVRGEAFAEDRYILQ